MKIKGSTLKYFRNTFIIACIIIVFTSSVTAADALYRLMHNDHDALIIGKVLGVDEKLEVQVVKQIISSKGISRVRKQISIKGSIIIENYPDYWYFAETSDIKKPKEGDFVLASIDKINNNFRIAWGLYKIDSLEYRDLSLVLPSATSQYMSMEAAAIKTFVNSGGTINEFGFDSSNGKLYANNKLIYDAAIDPIENVNIINEIVITSRVKYNLGIIFGVLFIAISWFMILRRRKNR